MFKILIDNLKVRSKIGVSLKERKKRQLLLFTINILYKVNNKKDIDNIDNLLSYTKIIRFIKNFIAQSEFKTLEKLIFECSKSLKKEFNFYKIEISIKKPEIAKKYNCKTISVSK